MRKLSSETEGRWNLAIGIVIMLLVAASSVWSVVQYRGLADCNRRAIRTLHARDQYTDRLRALADRDQANIDRLIFTVTEATDRDVFSQALTDYVTEARAVDEERDDTRRQQDRSTYPSLDDCD